jgi:hypothetical protein
MPAVPQLLYQCDCQILCKYLLLLRGADLETERRRFPPFDFFLSFLEITEQKSPKKKRSSNSVVRQDRCGETDTDQGGRVKGFLNRCSIIMTFSFSFYYFFFIFSLPKALSISSRQVSRSRDDQSTSWSCDRLVVLLHRRASANACGDGSDGLYAGS